MFVVCTVCTVYEVPFNEKRIRDSSLEGNSPPPAPHENILTEVSGSFPLYKGTELETAEQVRGHGVLCTDRSTPWHVCSFKCVIKF